MKTADAIRRSLGFVLGLGCLSLHAGQPVKDRVSSNAEMKRKYARSFVAEAATGIECFWGYRKDLNPKYGPERRIFVLDKRTSQVWPLSSPQIQEHLAASVGLKGLALDSGGEKVAALPVFLDPSTSAAFTRIVLIDVETRTAECFVDNGQLAYSPRFSPDGRHLAFYSTDRRTNPRLDPSLPLEENSGRVVEIESGKSRTITGHFAEAGARHFGDTGYWHLDPPKWLDADRVLFQSRSSDRALIRKYVPGFSGNLCPYVAVANVASGEVNRLFMPGGYGLIESLVDRDNKRVLLSNRQRLVQTNFDLGQQTTLAEANPSRRILNVRLKNGKVEYDIAERE